MGYNTSRRALERVLGLLEAIAKSKKSGIVIASEEPRRLRHQLRQGIWASKKWPDTVWLWEALGGDKLRLRSDVVLNCVHVRKVRPVQAEVIEVDFEEEEEIKEELPPEVAEDAEEVLERLGEYMSVQKQKERSGEWGPEVEVREDVRKARDVFAHMQGREDMSEVHFVMARLSDKEMEVVEAWGRSEGWALVGETGGPLSLTRKPVDDFLLWEPQGGRRLAGPQSGTG